MSDPDATADGGAAATPSLHDAGPAAGGTWAPPPPPAPRGRRRRRWPAVFGVAVAVVLIAALVAARVSVNYYVLTPGDASPVAPFIEVPAADNHPLTGKILLTDVFVTQLNALNYLQYRFFDSDSEVVSGSDLLGPSPDAGQFLNQGYLQMAQAQSFATAAALTRLGYTVTSTNAGALVYGIQPGSPALRGVAGGPGDHGRATGRPHRPSAPSSTRCTGCSPARPSRSASRSPPSTTSVTSCRARR